MIHLKVRFEHDNGTIIDAENQDVGFWTWRQFADYLARMYRWRQRFVVLEISGEDSHSYRTRMADGLEACTLDKCEDHWSSTNLFHWTIQSTPRQTDEEFLQVLNERIRETFDE